MSRLRNVRRGLTTLVIGAAVADQLRRPPEDRTWYGNIGGVPYDLRPPTFDRLRATVWNKDNPKLVVPTFFGVGWSINFYPLVHLVSR
jgi:hypothetical protein